MNAFDNIKPTGMINRTTFYDTIRPTLFKGKITQKQVEGMEAILKEWEVRALTDNRFLAYILATTYHETAKTMQPIAEYGKGAKYKYGKPDPITGHAYYGRGFVQLTWKYNYENMSKVTDEDLVNNPDLAMRPDVATKILFHGMLNGSFTGKQLDNYFNDHKTDPKGARKIINGVDKAELIAGYYSKFLAALS